MTLLGLTWLGLWRSRWRLLGASVMLAGLLAGMLSPPADLLISPDARLIALRSLALVQARPGVSNFERDAWSQYWAEPLTSAFPGSDASQPIPCDTDACRVEQGGATILLARSMHKVDCRFCQISRHQSFLRNILTRRCRSIGKKVHWIGSRVSEVCSFRFFGARPDRTADNPADR